MDDDRCMPDEMTMEFERGIGLINEPVRTIDDDRGKPTTSCCCADARTIDDER